MNAHAQALAAYGTPNIAQKPPRAVEYDALAQVTARLRAAIAGGPTAFPALADALDANRRLWTEFTFDLASDEKPASNRVAGPVAWLGQIHNVA